MASRNYIGSLYVVSVVAFIVFLPVIIDMEIEDVMGRQEHQYAGKSP